MLVGLVILLIVAGVVMAFVPFDPAVKRMILIVLGVVVGVLLLVWLLSVLGLTDGYYHRGPVIVP